MTFAGDHIWKGEEKNEGSKNCHYRLWQAFDGSDGSMKGHESLFEIKPTFATSGRWTEVTTGFAGELQAFADLILEGKKPPSEIYASYKSMMLYEAIRDTHGKAVNLQGEL